MQDYYLKQMGIDRWRERGVSEEGSPSLALVGYTLHTAEKRQIGAVLLDPRVQQAEANQLLLAMFRAIDLVPVLSQDDVARSETGFLVLMGADAVTSLVGRADAWEALRGAPVTAGQHALPAFVTYHPADLLDCPQDKRKAWEDLKRLVAFRREALS